MQKPPPDFRTNFEATHPPILIDNGLAILENDKIERHIMKNIPGGYNLFVQVSRSFGRRQNLILSSPLPFPGQRSCHSDREHLLKVEADAGEEG